jgi:NADH-quinone oxidoreductase subunit A
MTELLVMFGITAVIAFGAIGTSYIFGVPRHQRHKDMPYESGITPTGGAQVRMSIPYYLVAIFFLLFDVEVAFLFTWAVVAYDLGWVGFLKAMVFVGFLTAGLIYTWLRGGLEWRRHSKTV